MNLIMLGVVLQSCSSMNWADCLLGGMDIERRRFDLKMLALHCACSNRFVGLMPHCRKLCLVLGGTYRWNGTSLGAT